MSKLGKVLLFSIVFECTFATLYFGRAADVALSSMGSNQNSSGLVNSANSALSGTGLTQFVAILFSNPVAIGIIWSVLNVLIVLRMTLKSKSRI